MRYYRDAQAAKIQRLTGELQREKHNVKVLLNAIDEMYDRGSEPLIRIDPETERNRLELRKAHNKVHALE